MGSMAIALNAEYGEVWPSAISLTGSSCTTESPAWCSHVARIGRSAISPIPQLSALGIEKSGTSAPARRPRRRDSAMDSIQHPPQAFFEDLGRRQQAHHQVSLMWKV